jgi:hypothetical protein
MFSFPFNILVVRCAQRLWLRAPSCRLMLDPSRPGNNPPPSFNRHSVYSSECRYLAHYGSDLGKQVAKKEGAAAAAAPAEVKKSRSVLQKAAAVKARGESRVIDKVISTSVHRSVRYMSFIIFLVSLVFFVFVARVSFWLSLSLQTEQFFPTETCKTDPSSPLQLSVRRGAVQEWPPLRAHQLTARPERTLRWVR